MSVVIETTIGDITVDLFTDERPVACLNFVKLCKLKYYNYNLFHTVEQGFIAQCGDPTGAGDGGTSVWGVVEGAAKRFFEAESLPKIHHSSAGLLSLVSAGKNLVGSQFFFTLADHLMSLDGIHCVIGEVVEGHETLRMLNEAIVDENFRPYQDIRITHTVILDDPFPDPRGFQVPTRSPSPTAERLQNGRIAADEDIDDTDGKTMEEIQEMLAEREAKARATILEIVGDLPDAEMAPPENVLFVCKLNPVTTDDDLEIIFSRFGKVKTCEVIRDKKSGDSLQYAFVEFEDQNSCEAAYFKMDNVLIDDRRIHVDFSQSVAKVKWRGKGRGVDGADGRIDFNNLREPGRKEPWNHSNPSRNNDKPRENRNRGTDRGRMTSEERRCAREERHRAQQQQETRRRNRSRSRSVSPRRDARQRDAYESRRANERKHREQIANRGRVRSNSPKQRRADRRRSRSEERVRRRSRDGRHSPVRRNYPRRSRSPQGRQRNASPEYRNPYRAEQRKPEHSLERHKQLKRKKEGEPLKTKKKSTRKSKRDSPSSSSSSASDTDDTESDSSSQDSESSDSASSGSSEERHKKKKDKSKKRKEHKSKATKRQKKAKKHKK